MQAQCLLHLCADSHQRVHAALRLLKHHADVRALNFPQGGPVGVEQLLSVQQNLPGIVALLPGQKARHAHGSNGFAGAGFSHKAQNLSVPNGQAHAADRLPVPIEEPYVQIANFQHYAPPPLRRCRPSPMRPTPNTIHTRVSPVPMAYHGALRNIPCASESI